MIKKTFIAGLAAIIPIGITIYVISGLFLFADGILGKFINKFLAQYLGYKIPGLGIILFILIIFFTGLLIRLSRMRFYRWIEHVFFSMPLVNKIYFPIKKIVNFIFFPPVKTFKNAVLLEYPRKGIYSLGFVTNQSSDKFNEKIDKKLYNVFIPTTPSPLTGLTILAQEQELVFLDVSIEEAMKFIISGGLLNPND
ncbi:MAG: DUF502 domain-containing protein [Candidatus Omnitrophica bacterium]|nr:DUF502 domain-containing protein [Candidatus Omnitrophota bacterium]